MATKYASQYRSVASSSSAGQPVVNRHEWNVEISTDADKVIIGHLPAFHRLVPEACALIADDDVPACNVDLCVDSDAQVIVNNQAFAGATFTRAAVSLYEAVEAIGVSEVNRDIYLLLNTAPVAAGGKITAVIVSAPVS